MSSNSIPFRYRSFRFSRQKEPNLVNAFVKNCRARTGLFFHPCCPIAILPGFHFVPPTSSRCNHPSQNLQTDSAAVHLQTRHHRQIVGLPADLAGCHQGQWGRIARLEGLCLRETLAANFSCNDDLDSPSIITPHSTTTTAAK